ncbi:MAG: hypothetical protein O3C27_03765 [Actinomycetota bacterium]|nr:hypothetical protein [Actinomycetota bacterium]
MFPLVSGLSWTLADGRPSLRYVGIGVVYDQSGQMWTTHRFMTLGDSPAATATTPPPTTAAPIAQTTTTQPGASTTPSTVPATPPPNNAGPLAPTAVAGVLASMAGSGI